jgi:hypothetical protein
MVELKDNRPEVNVSESEYKRLLGFPTGYEFSGRVRELADWARQWLFENGRPWIYGSEVPVEIQPDGLRLNGTDFAAPRLREQLIDAQADRAVLVAVSAGKECEEKARQLWREEKPDEYFFMEMFGSAVVEQLVTNAGARICAFAEQNGMAVLPHYSPGYSGWDTAEQKRLFEAISHKAGGFPGDLRVLESGMLQPKKSLLAVFGVTEHIEKVRQLTNLVPCENCSFSPCQYRRAPYRHSLPQIEDVRWLQPNGVPEESIVNGWPLDHNARYSINLRALRKWAEERLKLRIFVDRSVEAHFRYEGTTCSNLGRPLAYDYFIKFDGPKRGYRIVEATCAPAPGDLGHSAMCEYINGAERLTAVMAMEKPLLGQPLNDVLKWKRAFSPAGCYCDADSRMHKWGLVLEVIHYALARSSVDQKVLNELNKEATGVGTALF